MVPLLANADEEPVKAGDGPFKISSHEPSLLGWTRDRSSDGYMDFQLSVRLAIAPSWIDRLSSETGKLFFAFTGRFGQYFDRASSPVIGKRFNPELFYRHGRPGHTTFDFGYGHESNGQRINSQEAYEQARRELDQPEQADDYISRGWDYVRATVRFEHIRLLEYSLPIATQLTLRRYLENGLLQEQAEEYNTWENNPAGKPRDEVDGIQVLLEYVYRTARSDRDPVSDVKIALGYTTGYRDAFRNGGWRFELGTKILEMPLVLWTQRGYNTDLIRYYRRESAAGIALQIGAF